MMHISVWQECVGIPVMYVRVCSREYHLHCLFFTNMCILVFVCEYMYIHVCIYMHIYVLNEQL